MPFDVRQTHRRRADCVRPVDSSGRYGNCLRGQTVTWQQFDVTLDLQSDGSYHVTERQVIRFEGGTFSGGFATLPLDRIDGIYNILLSEEIDGLDEPYLLLSWSRYDDDAETYTYRETGSEIEIAGDFRDRGTRTFILEYDVTGALRVYGTGAEKYIYLVDRDIWRCHQRRCG